MLISSMATNLMMVFAIAKKKVTILIRKSERKNYIYND